MDPSLVTEKKIVSPEDWKVSPVIFPTSPYPLYSSVIPSESKIISSSQLFSTDPESIVRFRGDPSELTYSN